MVGRVFFWAILWQDGGVFLTGLNHVNVRTHRLAEMIAFYRDVLGMSQGPRPAFSFPGAWMYVGTQPVVHLVGVDVAPTPGDSLRLQHFAFAAQNQTAFLAHLETCGVAYRIGTLEDFKLVQVNVIDPDGNHIHVDFELR
ncbi:MAG: VOC family protein [Deltaproteobacteria bacterium]|nr:VOC family protein [Deltaproteobacteria bacterium]